MKTFSKILLAASVAVAASSQAAMLPSDTQELVLNLSGATAQDKQIRAIVEDQICDSDYTTFTNDGDLKSNQYAYFCKVSVNSVFFGSAAGTPAVTSLDQDSDGNINLLVRKLAKGGSGTGPIGLCESPVDQLVVSAASCQNAGTDADYQCDDLEQVVSDGGLSDLEFSTLPPTAGGSSCNGVTLSENSIWGTIFSTPVSLNLRDALQCVQGLSVGAEDEANMPSLPKSLIGSAFSGGIATWLDVNIDGVSLPQRLAQKIAAGECPSYSHTRPASLEAYQVTACRRVDTSGTNTQFRVKFLGEFCAISANGMLVDNTSNSSINPDPKSVLNWAGQSSDKGLDLPAIHETSGSSDMSECLDAFSDPSLTGAQVRWAFGIQSLEKNVGPAYADGDWRFIKIDGIAPTTTNTLNGSYFDWVESVWNWRADLDAVKAELQKQIVERTAVAANIGSTAQGKYVHEFGQSGIFGLNTFPGNTVGASIDLAAPVNPFSHVSNGVTNSCRLPSATDAVKVTLN